MKCVEVYKELYHQEPFDVAFCPYRISPLGAHIDHQYGKINGLAIDKGIHMAYHPKQNGVVELQSLNFPKRAQFFVSAVPDEKQGDWADHLRGAAKMLGEKYRLKVGLSGIIEGSLPIGGLSSSASVIICFLSALCKVNGVHLEPMEMILTAKAAENQYLWFLPCFFVTVAFFNILVNLGGRKFAYIAVVLMSLVYVVLPMPELPWGINRVFKYIGFYAVGVFLAGRETKIADRNVGTGVAAVVLLTVNFFLSLYNLTTGLMWFVTALIGVTAMILISQFINENKILQYFGRISLIVLCIHGPVYRIVVKIVSIPLHMGTDAVRGNILLAMIVVAITMIICSVAYEVVVRIAPLMIGKKR